jgi:hypothetical protein
LLDPLGSNDLPSRDKVKKVVRAILERKYGLMGDYVQMVVDSITDDPIKLREPRYTKSRRAPKAEVSETAEPRIALVLNDDHTIHHVQERGYVEAPVRIRSILSGSTPREPEKMPAKRYSTGISGCATGGWSLHPQGLTYMALEEIDLPLCFRGTRAAAARRDSVAGYSSIRSPRSIRTLLPRAGGGLRHPPRRCSRGLTSLMPWCGRPAITPRRAPSAASAISITAPSPPISCRAMAAWRSSTSTITTATASRRSSITAPMC